MFSFGRGLVFAALAAAVCLAGCSAATTRLFTKPIAQSTYVSYREWGPNRTVAVLPFVNVSKDKDAASKARDLFISELYISGAFKDVVDEGEMMEVMRKLKVRETDPLGKDTIKTLGDNLGAQALIFGTVEEYNERTSKAAQFAISMRMVDVDTGSILWVGDSSQEGGGSISEALGLSEGPMVIDVARHVLRVLIDDLASEVKDRKVKEKKGEEAAKKGGGQKDVAAKGTGGKKGAAEQQAVAAPPAAVKANSAGMTAPPFGMGGK